MFAGKPWGHSPLPAPKGQLLPSHLVPGVGESQVSQPHLGSPGRGEHGKARTGGRRDPVLDTAGGQLRCEDTLPTSVCRGLRGRSRRRWPILLCPSPSRPLASSRLHQPGSLPALLLFPAGRSPLLPLQQPRRPLLSRNHSSASHLNTCSRLLLPHCSLRALQHLNCGTGFPLNPLLVQL